MPTEIKEPRCGTTSPVTAAPGRPLACRAFPPRPVNGEMVACFLTPSIDAKYTYPAELKDEIAEAVGEYMFDMPDFRTDEKERLLRDVKEMTRRRFALAEHLSRQAVVLFGWSRWAPTACTTGSGSTWTPITPSTSRVTPRRRRS